MQNGYLWVFPVRAEKKVVVIKGDESTTLKAYEFGNRAMTHKVRGETFPIFSTRTM
jgi:hypothetical protein